MIELAVAHVEDPATEDATSALIEQAREQTRGRPVRAGILLAGIDHDHAAATAALAAAFPGIQLIGCTTDGEMSSVGGYCEDSLLLLLFVGDGFEARAGIGRAVDVDMAAAVDAAIAEARAGLQTAPRLCLTTPESLGCDAVALIGHLRRALGAGVPVFGGTAGDGWRFAKSLQFCGTEVTSNAVPVLLIAGDVKLAQGVACGWTPIGSPSVATEVEGNVVHRIGEVTAIEYYRQHLGQHLLPLLEYPLAVHDEAGGFQLRSPVGHDLERGSVIFAGSVPAGARVQISTADRDGIIDATRSSIEKALADFGEGRPTGALFVSCAARKQLLGTRTAEELAIARRSALGGLPFAGFYSYGELSPPRAGEPTAFHNETFVTVLFGAT